MLQRMRRKEKGFTLVELIVVLVILAILIALLIPALTGYIDKANEKKVLSEAKGIWTAAQAAISEQYGEQEDFTQEIKCKAQDGSKRGRITNWALYQVQQTKPSAPDSHVVNYAIARSVNTFLDNRYDFRTTNNPLGKNVNTYVKENSQPGIIVSYDAKGKVEFVEFGYYGYLARIDGNTGEGKVTKDGTFSKFPSD